MSTKQNSQPWVLITGALGGIGRALVKQFSEHYFNVLAVDVCKNDGSFDGLANVQVKHLDLELFVLDEAYAQKIIDEIQVITQGEGLTALINNAAVQILAPTDEITSKDWSQSFHVNLYAPFFLVQHFLSDLEKNKGAVVNISSIHATQTKKTFVAYATTKAALSALTRNLAVDVGDRVRFNAIEPAAISTNMLIAGFNGKEDKYQELENYHPLGRIGSPEEVAKLAYFLASDEAEFVQGSCISASGGIQGCLSDPS